MAISNTLTATGDQVRRIAEQALNDLDGYTLRFTVARWGSLDAANKAARSFQTSFASMRARERRIKQGKLEGTQPTLYTDIQGRYDVLTCNKRPMEYGLGYEIVMNKVDSSLLEFDIVNSRTGEPVAAFSQSQLTYNKINKLFADKYGEAKLAGHVMFDPLTAEEKAEFFRVCPFEAPYIYWYFGLGPKPQAEIDAELEDARKRAELQGLTLDTLTTPQPQFQAPQRTHINEPKPDAIGHVAKYDILNDISDDPEIDPFTGKRIDPVDNEDDEA